MGSEMCIRDSVWINFWPYISGSETPASIFFWFCGDSWNMHLLIDEVVLLRVFSSLITSWIASYFTFVSTRLETRLT